ncbi:Secreted protein [Colletotrichum spinosum]|uniref:Secreted protein n=1 Tax=Colletotrichum spinosum TaxID=1347390 RepID=A0A4R8QAP1_9PEZI|nr:Secreted protein [Colletotrichum spinosum]
MSSVPSSPDLPATSSFTQFPKLPPEIRRRIWALAIPTARVVELDAPYMPEVRWNLDCLQDRTYCDMRYTSRLNAGPLPLSRASREACHVAGEAWYLSKERRADGFALETFNSLRCQQLDPTRDIVHLHWHSAYAEASSFDEDDVSPLQRLRECAELGVGVSIMADLLSSFWQYRPRRIGSIPCLSPSDVEIFRLLSSFKDAHVCLAMVNLHVTREQVARSSLFPTPIQLVDAFDHPTLEAMHQLLLAKRSANEEELGDTQAHSMFAQILDRESFQQRVRSWTDEVTHIWLWHRYTQSWSSIMNESHRVTEPPQTSWPSPPYFIKMTGRTWNRFHPWVKAEIDAMPKFKPVIMFRHCLKDCPKGSGRFRRLFPKHFYRAAVDAPRGPLAWGQLNFLHTTDTHGWLEGHIREQNYGADWGDFVSFVKHMRQKADDLDVDLLLVDTGDLHDGAGLSDATGVSSYANGTGVNGQISNPVFEKLDYDVLAIGNHELYISSIAYETFNQLAKTYGDRYLTSNVQIRNPCSGELEYIGKQYRYFTTPKGLRIMAFGVLFDFTGNSNASVVTPAATMVRQPWFLSAVNHTEPVDLFLVIGHNPVRPTQSSSTLKTVFDAIRAVRPDTPVQFFGGHTHIRDFAVYDDKSTALESGRYCETVGWLSLTGVKSDNYKGALYPEGVPHPSQKAAVTTTKTASVSPASATGNSSLTYFRRYLDWNTLTFEYHAVGSQIKTFNTTKGVGVSNEITAYRKTLNLTTLYGCAPQTWCLSCAPFMSEGSIYSLLTTALAATVVAEERSSTPRIIIANTGHIRFDLAQGPFDYDSSFIVSPFTDAFQYIPDVPWSYARQVLANLESGNFPSKRRRTLSSDSFAFGQGNTALSTVDKCIDPPVTNDHFAKRSYAGGRIVRRQAVTPGYTTTDDFGSDGDDTIHTEIPTYDYPNFFQVNSSFPENVAVSDDTKIDLVFLDYIAGSVVSVLQSLGGNYTSEDVSYYLPSTFTTNSYLPEFAKNNAAWQENVPNCPVGLGIGYNTTIA